MRQSTLSIHTTAVSAIVVVLLAVDASAVNDHLKCYEIKDPLALKGIVDLNSPQFGLEAGCVFKEAKKFCVPATKTVVSAQVKEQPVTPAPFVSTQELLDDYICYRVDCAPPFPPDTTAHDQFGPRILTKFKPFEFCGPARKCRAAGTFLDVSTGQAPAGPGDPDPIWELVSAPVRVTAPAAPVVVPLFDSWGLHIIPLTGGPQAFPGSQWISPNSGCGTNSPGCPQGDYTYRTCWHQCCDASLALDLLADNCATVSINGSPIGMTPACGGQGPFIDPTLITATVTTPTGGIDTCLEVVVTNQDQTASGLDIAGSVSFASCP